MPWWTSWSWAASCRWPLFTRSFQFEGTEVDDVTNCTNRAPYRTLHLLREDSIDEAVEAYPEAEMIYERNMQSPWKTWAWRPGWILTLGPRCPITGRTLNTPHEEKSNLPNRPPPRNRTWPPSLACGPVKAWNCSRRCTSSPARASSTKTRGASSNRSITCTSSLRLSGRAQRQRPPRHPGRPRRGQVLPGLHPV